MLFHLFLDFFLLPAQEKNSVSIPVSLCGYKLHKQVAILNVLESEIG